MTAETIPAALPAAPSQGLTPRTARRLATAERVLYGAGGVLVAVGPHTGYLPLHAAALAAGAGTLVHLWRRTRSGGSGLLTACCRALPVLGLSGCYTAALASPGVAWWEVVAPVATAAAAGIAAPVTRSLGLKQAADDLPEMVAAHGAELHVVTPAGQTPADAYETGLHQMWTASPATGDTALTAVHRPAEDRPDFTAVILAPAGQAVPRSLDKHAVAAVFDVPPDAVTLAPVKGTGPGRVALRVAPVEAAETGQDDDEVRTLWELRVSGPSGVAPGMLLADYRLTDDRLVVLVQAAEDHMIDLRRKPLARALRVEDPELIMIETDGMANGVVTIYREHPLIHIREATRADLTMDKDGRVTVGLRHDGRPARMRLYDPELGALTDLLVGAPGSGKSVTLLTLLAAERLSGVVSVVADAQDGMSLPEADSRVFHFGKGRAALGATLAALCAVADYREQISAANGWGSFTLGNPWSLVIATLDEINRVLAADADVHQDFRKWVAGMISRVQLTGRKLGMGIRFAGQSIHLADLGDSDKIRSGARQGTVWLGRVNGTMTSRMAQDMTDRTIEVTPIPNYFGAGGSSEVAAAWTGEEAPPGPVTAGCAWMIQGGHPAMTRVFRAVKKNRTYPGLIALMEVAPVPGFTPEETDVFTEAYAEALPYAEDLMIGGKAAAEPTPDAEDGTGDDYADDAYHAVTAPKTPAPARGLRDCVLAALADGPLRTREIRQAVGVGTDGGPASGSVDNALSKLADEGHVVRAGHGIWSRPE
ncbi:hypothetical protein [Streptomyces sp. NBC_01618]|uniref:hypothetical protein n=1 Tax=Streptomyces sp. NBC_01618 TaxID=2975900 RepID=UPI0038663760|nr:hypothetical protein OH735_08510 [Streptomyces sp. NBC_01618]